MFPQLAYHDHDLLFIMIACRWNLGQDGEALAELVLQMGAWAETLQFDLEITHRDLH